ncbi:MAG: class I tRNA ligase family protein, partial [Coriobacteriales bacterium]|nr:class I tRNA ligase family protein [Coriobacteriales bacterium]
IYATILAKDGSRMSKSKGNGVDPMDLMNKYGADAMRFNLLTLITNNQDVKFDANIDKKTHELIDSPRTEQARGFVTKIWNASRFVQMNLDGYEPGAPLAETPEDAWMLSRLAKMVASATKALETYQLGDYAREIQAFFWNEICDWYIELCKGRLLGGDAEEKLQVQRNLVYVLDVALRLLHPVMPFVTEKVWDALPASGLDAHDSSFLMMAAWPNPDELAGFVNDAAEREFELARRVVSAVRSTRARYRLSPKAELDVCVRSSADDAAVLERQRGFICNVGRVDQLALGARQDKPFGSITVLDGGLEIFVVVGGLVDLAAEAKRVEKDLAKAEKDLASVTRTLSNQGFVSKAAPEVIAKKQAQAAELEQTIAQLKAQAADFA